MGKSPKSSAAILLRAISFLGTITNLMHKPIPGTNYITVNKKSQKIFPFKTVLHLSYFLVVWIQLYLYKQIITVSQLVTSLMYAIALSIHASQIPETNKKREEIACLFNSIQNFEQRYAGMLKS